MLINIYLVTTAISWAVTFMFSSSCEKKLKRKGYKIVKEKKSFSEKLADFVSAAVKGSIPVYNILNAILIVCVGNKFYEYMEKELLASGEIYMPIEEGLNNDCESQILNNQKADTYTASMQNTRTEKTYDEMTTEEKLVYLQQEKEKLINQSTPQVENSFTSNERRK